MIDLLLLIATRRELAHFGYQFVRVEFYSSTLCKIFTREFPWRFVLSFATHYLLLELAVNLVPQYITSCRASTSTTRSSWDRYIQVCFYSSFTFFCSGFYIRRFGEFKFVVGKKLFGSCIMIVFSSYCALTFVYFFSSHSNEQCD